MAGSTTNRWKLGLFVVLGFITGFAGLIWIGSRRFHRESYRAITYFDESVQGLDIGSQVKFRGVNIGSVAAISVAPDHRHVEVACDIDLAVIGHLGLRIRDAADGQLEPLVPDDLRVQLVAAGITGQKFVGADFFDPKRYPPPDLPFPTPHNYLPSTSSTLKSLEEAVMEATNHLPEIGQKVTALLERIDRTIADADVPGVVKDVRGVMQATDANLRALHEAGLVTRTAEVLAEAKEALATVRRLGDDLAAEKGPLASALGRVQAAAASLEKAVDAAEVGETAKTVRATAGQFGETAKDLGEMEEELRSTLVAAREAMEAVRALADMLERDPSALLHGKSPEAQGTTKP